MPSDGLALIGFMGQREAMKYLEVRCAYPDVQYATLLGYWREARTRLGEPFATAGKPDVREIPAGHAEHLDRVCSNPSFDGCIAGMKSHSYKMVEIDPLLAYQQHIELGRSAITSTFASNPPSTEEMLERCLPLRLRDISLRDQRIIPASVGTPMGVVISSDDANLSPCAAGYLGKAKEADGTDGPHVGGILLRERASFLQVLEYAGRCYLRNGFHRAYSLKIAGATHLPCLYLQTDDYARIEIPEQGAFSASLLASGNPPTCGHFSQGRAYPVRLRDFVRAFKVTWEDCSYLL